MATQTMVTASMAAHAAILLERAPTWSRGTRNSDGRAFVVFTSSMPGVVYYSSADGCSCRGFYFRNLCAHVVACRQESERATAKRLPRYVDLFPADEFERATAAR